MVQIPDLILDYSKKKPPAKAVAKMTLRFSWICIAPASCLNSALNKKYSNYLISLSINN